MTDSIFTRPVTAITDVVDTLTRDMALARIGSQRYREPTPFPCHKRTSFKDEVLAGQLYLALRAHLPLSRGGHEVQMIGDSFRLYEYPTGGACPSHKDARRIISSPHNPGVRLRSELSILLYLTAPQEGGETMIVVPALHPFNPSCVEMVLGWPPVPLSVLAFDQDLEHSAEASIVWAEAIMQRKDMKRVLRTEAYYPVDVVVPSSHAPGPLPSRCITRVGL